MSGSALKPSDRAPGLLIGEGVSFGEGVLLGGHVIIHSGVEVRDGARVGDHAQVRDRVTIGAGTTVGSHVTIDPGVSIGDRVSLQTGCYITGGAVVEDDVFVGPGAILTNDNTMDRHSPAKGFEGPILRRACRVGGGAVICPGIEIGEESFVAAGAVVTADVEPRTVVMGVPAQRVRDVGPEDLLENWR